MKYIKACKKCGEEKEAAVGFHRHKQNKDGYYGTCKACRKAKREAEGGYQAKGTTTTKKRRRKAPVGGTEYWQKLLIEGVEEVRASEGDPAAKARIYANAATAARGFIAIDELEKRFNALYQQVQDMRRERSIGTSYSQTKADGPRNRAKSGSALP